MMRHGQGVLVRRRRGVILPIMLLVLALLGLMAAGTSFYVHADLSAARGGSHRLQARLAAESGLQKVMFKLRTDQTDVSLWYHNPEEYHRIIVWGSEATEQELGSPFEYPDDDFSPRYRFSIVADDPLDDEVRVRYGITDESSKLNINVATRNELLLLVGQVAGEDVVVEEVVDALIDWRDADSVPGVAGEEGEVYARFNPPYAIKNAPFDTVEELLLVRGINGMLLYGEDTDRNGLMSPNEDDGEESFPPDDADGVLNRGLMPYITVYSRSLNRSSENTPRINVLSDPTAVSEMLSEREIADQAKIDFVSQAGGGQTPITSPAQLLLSRTTTAGGGDPQSATQNPPTETPSPLTLEDMIWVMDLLTTSNEQEFVGLINVNTAPAQVLRTLPGMTDEEVSAIIEVRGELPPEDKRSVGWLAPVLGEQRFVEVAPRTTARGNRFHVESLGYADHLGTVVRLEAIVEMRGPIAQIVYNRDITMLGTAYPIRYAEDDPELVGFNER
jgi:type II secretory pathway component PulK